MIGLITLIVGVVYCAVLVVATRAAYRWAKNKGLSKAKCRFAAAGGFLVVYLPVFWDHIPTLIAHQYYCATESGFWVYKTPEQWRKENLGVLETLNAPGATGSPVRHARSADGHEIIDTYILNERFNWIIAQRDLFFLLPIVITERLVLDALNNEVLARYIDFSSGNSVKYTIGPPGPIKFWLQNSNCVNGERNREALSKFRDNFYGVKR